MITHYQLAGQFAIFPLDSQRPHSAKKWGSSGKGKDLGKCVRSAPEMSVVWQCTADEDCWHLRQHQVVCDGQTSRIGGWQSPRCSVDWPRGNPTRAITSSASSRPASMASYIIQRFNKLTTALVDNRDNASGILQMELVIWKLTAPNRNNSHAAAGELSSVYSMQTREAAVFICDAWQIDENPCLLYGSVNACLSLCVSVNAHQRSSTSWQPTRIQPSCYVS